MKTKGQQWIATLLSALFLTSAIAATAGETPSGSNVAKVDLNTATQQELETLPGVGPSKAQAIIEHRERKPFKKVEDLMRVKGFGRKTYKKLMPYLTVNPSK